MAIWTMPTTGELANSRRWDAEAFTPFLRTLDSKFRKSPQLLEIASVTHPSEIPRVYTDASGAVVFLLAQNIRPLLPETVKEFRIARATADAIPLNRLQNGDVLVTRSGANSGTCAVYLGRDGDCYTSGEGLIVRSFGDIDGAYLAAFFNTSAGQALCRRAIYGSGQPHIGPKYLEQTRIPRLGKVEARASRLVRAAYQEMKAAEALYPQAEAELLQRLRYQETQSAELTYVQDFNQLARARRTDAEFFQPQYSRLRKSLSERGAASIDTFCPKPSRGVQPLVQERGEVFVIDSKAVRVIGVEPSSSDRTSTTFYNSPANQKARLHHNDVLLNSTGRGTLGRAGWYQLDKAAICDNHVTILRPHPEICNPIYLSLFLNSPAGRAQSEQFQTGSSGQLEIYPQHIQQFLVYLPQQKNGFVDLAWQKKLAAKVEAASRARVAATEKLEEAKRLVEDAITESFANRSRITR